MGDSPVSPSRSRRREVMKTEDRALSCCSTCSGSCRSTSCACGGKRAIRPRLHRKSALGRGAGGRTADVLVTGVIYAATRLAWAAGIIPISGFCSRRPACTRCCRSPSRGGHARSESVHRSVPSHTSC